MDVVEFGNLLVALGQNHQPGVVGLLPADERCQTEAAGMPMGA